MKKAIFASAAILMAVISTQAQTNDAVTYNNNKPTKEERKAVKKEKKQEGVALRKMEGNEVSYQAKQEFIRNFGDHPDAVWTKARFFDEAAFYKDGVATTAYYDYDGQLVGTTSIRTFADLPAAGQKKISKEYKDYTIKNIIFFDDNENNDTDMYLYGSQFDDADNYFVELQKDDKTIIVQVTMDGLAGYFASL